MLYPEVKYSPADITVRKPCEEWGYDVIYSEANPTNIVVCESHKKGTSRPSLAFPGHPVTELLDGFDYRERGCLSPIKLMAQITRRRSKVETFVGTMFNQVLLGQRSIWSLCK